MMQRRSFLGAVLASFAAPAIVKASSLMQVRAPGGFKASDGGLLVPDAFCGAFQYSDDGVTWVDATDMPVTARYFRDAPQPVWAAVPPAEWLTYDFGGEHSQIGFVIRRVA
jgi:hypothetical protein